MIARTQMQIHNLPIQLVILSTGQVAFVKASNFNPIYSDFGVEGKIPVIISEECVTIGAEEDCVIYQYNAAYLLKDCEMLKNWLNQECLEAPW